MNSENEKKQPVNRLSRRTFFKGAGLAAAAGISGCEKPAGFSVQADRIPIPTYESINVTPLINCRGTYTAMSGSLMLPETRKAMIKASERYVMIEELMNGVGARISEMTGAEWGIVTSGCAAALFAATAACVAGTDRELQARLPMPPNVKDMKNECIMCKSHRNGYDRAVRMLGVNIIEVETKEEMEAAVNERTAMILIMGQSIKTGTITFENMIAIGKKNNIPVLVDAAAERPDVPNMYLQGGADLVAYSGGKCLRGPQSSGLLMGRKDLCQAAFRNISPHGGMGRPMKVGKEEIMALLTALDLWINGRDHAAERKEWDRRFAYISDKVTQVASVKTEVVEANTRPNNAPTLHITWDPNTVKIEPREVAKQLTEGSPRIVLFTGENGVRIMSYMMEPDDEIPVASRIHEILSSAV
jgi:uncharacterized pyridoxal phosphate-dependent enzyme